MMVELLLKVVGFGFFAAAIMGANEMSKIYKLPVADRDRDKIMVTGAITIGAVVALVLCWIVATS